MLASPPLIVTITLDAAAHHYFTSLRNQHFPAHCNYLEAHLTMFHHLPSDDPAVDAALQRSSQVNPFSLEVTGVKNIGNGTAFIAVSPVLSGMHAGLQKAFTPFLISQDKQKLWPHITVQNKVTAFKAKQTTDILLKDFKPFTVQAVGIDTWLYLKGPWQHHRHYAFGLSGAEAPA
jgi:hypothetical protein